MLKKTELPTTPRIDNPEKLAQENRTKTNKQKHQQYTKMMSNTDLTKTGGGGTLAPAKEKLFNS